MIGSDLAILIPVLGRPERAASALEDALSATPDALVLFVASPGDDAEHQAIADAGGVGIVVDWPAGDGDYARKINLGFAMVTGRITTTGRSKVPHTIKTVGRPLPLAAAAEWVFLGADDLRFRAGWYQSCLNHHRSSGACVIGTNDLGNSRTATGAHSTHTLVNEGYWACGTADATGRILHPEYRHEYVDDELVHTARWRHAYAHAPEAVVEHLHPDWGKGAEDATYEKARSGRQHDTRLFRQRELAFWGSGLRGGRR